MKLCLAGRQIELTAVELRCARGDRVGVALDLVPRELLACEHLCLARGKHDFTGLDVG